MTFQVFCQKMKNFTFQRAYHKLQYRIWSTGSILLLVRPANAPVDPFPCKPCAGELRAVTEADLPDGAAFEDPAHYLPVYKKMLERGGVIHFGYLGGKCVYRHAATFSGTLDFRGCVVRRLGEKEMFTHFSYCAPEARGGGWQTESLREFFRLFPGYRSYTCVKDDNFPSLIPCFRAGYRPYSRITVKKRFFRSALTETPLTEEEAEDLLALARPQNN